MNKRKINKIIRACTSVGMVIPMMGATAISSYAAALPIGGHTKAPTNNATYLNYYDPSETYSTRLARAKNGTQAVRTVTPTKKDIMYNSDKTGYRGSGVNPYPVIRRNLSDWSQNLATALPNCIGYAYGRTYETLGYDTAELLWKCNLGNNDPWVTWNNNKSKKIFKTGQVPKNNSLLIGKINQLKHVIYIEKVTPLGNGRYQLETTESNASAAKGAKSTSSWSKRSGWNCGDATFNHRNMIYSSANASNYEGFIYLTEPTQKAVAVAQAHDPNSFQ